MPQHKKLKSYTSFSSKKRSNTLLTTAQGGVCVFGTDPIIKSFQSTYVNLCKGKQECNKEQ